MKNLIYYIISLIAICFIMLSTVDKSNGGEQLLSSQRLNTIIKDKGVGWIAAETSKSGLSKEDKRQLCGLNPIDSNSKNGLRKKEGNPNKVEEKNLPENDPRKAKQFHAVQGVALSLNTLSESEAGLLPSHFDWRNKDGYNWTSPIKDQGRCGSCWAFASIALMESKEKIGFGDSSWPADYSEQFMVSCSEGDCTLGWYLDTSAEFLRFYGVPSEDCYPYQAQDLPCEKSCPDWETQISKVPDWNWISGFPQPVSVVQIKQKLLKGPLLVGFIVYEDFMYYSEGVYEHVSGDMLGGHAIVIVGWDDDSQSWICSNSWGNDWGESGCFRIKMGKNECQIEEEIIYYSTPVRWDCDLEENFEEVVDSLPDGWEKKAHNSDYTWKVSEFPVYEGSQAITIEYDPEMNQQDELLVSPYLKGTNMSVALAFMGSYYWAVTENKYKVSLWVIKGEWDEGKDDDLLLSDNILKDHLQADDESWIWTPVEYPLPGDYDHTPIRIAFRYQGEDGAQFSLDKVCIRGIEEENCECSLNDTGNLDIGQGSAKVVIKVQHAPNQVKSFAYDITYDPNQILYLGFESEEGFKNPDCCDCREVGKGRIQCRGEGNQNEDQGVIISEGYSGPMLTIKFKPLKPTDEGIGLCLENMSKDMEGWETSNGCFLPANCPIDINGDGQITPNDALCVYEKVSQVCPASCGPCEEICCDVDDNGECNPDDAMSVFEEYFKL